MAMMMSKGKPRQRALPMQSGTRIRATHGKPRTRATVPVALRLDPVKATAQRKPGLPGGSDPERVKSPGRTLSRPAHWPAEGRDWSDYESDRKQPKPRKQTAWGPLCETCWTRRSRTGVCQCGA